MISAKSCASTIMARILAATGGVSGTFNPVIVSNVPNVQSSLSYDANDVFLNVNVSFTPSGGALSLNQQNVANAITGFFNATRSLPAAFGTLNAAGLTTASGELGTGVIQSSIKADDLFLNLLLDPTVAGRVGVFSGPGGDEASAYADKRRAPPRERDAYAMATKAPRFAAEPANRWDVWGVAYGGSETVGGNALAGSQDLKASVHGLVAGADYTFLPDTVSASRWPGAAPASRLPMGSAPVLLTYSRSVPSHGAVSVRPISRPRWPIYGWHDVTTKRAVALAGVDQLQGRFRADTFSGRFEGGYRFATPWVGITPYAAAQVISFRVPAYAEQTLAGAGLFALNYAAQTTTDTRTEIGLRGDRSFATQDAVLTLHSRAAWAHDYDPGRAVTALFQALPGANFVVNGAAPAPILLWSVPAPK
jgi:Autotransporter beta-domain